MADGSARISPTAHATGYMWYRHGLSHPGLVNLQGRALDVAFSSLTGVVRRTTGVSFDALMLARHRGIDAQLEAAVADGRITQVIELAAGFSPRGWRLMQRHGERLTYIETDLPHMVAEKQRRLERAGLLREGHTVRTLDVLQADGPQSLAAIAGELDPGQGLAIITEGLMNYLDPEQARGVWRRIAATLSRFAHGQYLSDFYLSSENRGWMMSAFAGVLQSFVRGRMHVHFESADEAAATLGELGFVDVHIHRSADLPATRELAMQRGADRVRILEAWATE